MTQVSREILGKINLTFKTDREGSDKKTSSSLVTFISTYFIVAIMVMILTPPLQTADSVSHFQREYIISSGNLFADGKFQIPNSLVRFEKNWALPYNVKVVQSQFRESETMSFGGPTSIAVDSTSIYQPAMYLPAAIFIDIARLATDKIIISYYFAELGNLLVFLFLVRWSLRKISLKLRRLFMLLLFFPMSISLSVSTNPDCLLIGFAFAAAAAMFANYIEQLNEDKEKHLITFQFLRSNLSEIKIYKYEVVFFVFFFFLCTEKPVYLPLVFLPQLIDLYEGRFKRYVYCVLFQLVTSMFGFYIWTRFISLSLSSGSVNNQRVIGNIGQFALIVCRTVARDYNFIWTSCIGILGWLQAPLPGWFYVFWNLTLIFAFVLSVKWSRLIKKNIVLIAATLVCCALIIFAISWSQYVAYTPQGSQFINGFQGRYLLEILPFSALSISFTFPKNNLENEGLDKYSYLEAPLVSAIALVVLIALSSCLLGYYWLT